MKTRKLKIESSADATRKYRTCKPSVIRLKGQWLAQAGFPPGQSVELTAISPGVIEIRLCTVPLEDHTFHIAAMRLDHAIEAAQKGGA